MKQTKRMLALLLAAAMGIMQMPAAGVYAEDGSDPEQTVTAAEETPDTTEEMVPTDGPIELTVGKPYTLYNVPYSGYEKGNIAVNITQGAAIAGLSRSEDGLWLQLTATAPGMIYLDVRSEYNDGTITDAYGRVKMTDFVFEAVSEPGTSTATNNSSYSLELDQAQAIHFWNPVTMTAEDAEIIVTQGEELLQVTYVPGNDHVDIITKGEGIAILEIKEKNTDAPCYVRIKIGNPEDTAQPYTDPTEYPEEYPTTDVGVIDPQEKEYPEAYIGYDFYNEPWIFPVGTEPTFQSANLIFYLSQFDTLRNTGFTVASHENDMLYRFDTSHVDIDTCGMYPFYLHTNGGVTKMLTTYAQNLDKGTYYFMLKEHDELGFLYMDDGKEKPITVPTADALHEEALDVGRFTKMNDAEPWFYEPDYTVEVEDPNVIAAYCDEESGAVYVMGIGSGDSQVTVRDEEGKVRSAVKYEVYPAATTTTAPENPFETTTTTVTTEPFTTPTVDTRDAKIMRLYANNADGNVTWCSPVGQEIDFSADYLTFCVMANQYSSSYTDLLSTAFPVGSGKYTDLYEYDTSKVDTSKAGVYPVILRTKGGTSKRVQVPEESGQPFYMFNMQSFEQELFIYIDDGKEKPVNKQDTDTDNIARCELGSYSLHTLGEGCTVEIEDPNVLQLYLDEANDRYVIMCVGEGSSQVIVRDENKQEISRIKYLVTGKDAVFTTTTFAGQEIGTTTTTTKTTTVVTDPTEPPAATTTTAATTYAAAETTTEAPTTAVWDYEPILFGDRSAMTVGEERTFRILEPAGKEISKAKIGLENDAEILDVTSDGGDIFTVKALAAGSVRISISTEDAAFSAYLDLEVIEDGTELTTETFCGGLKFVYVPTDAMRVGEERRIYVCENHSSQKPVTWMTFRSMTDNVTCEYHEGDDYFTVTALSSGSADIEVYEGNGLGVSTTLHLEIVGEALPEMTTAAASTTTAVSTEFQATETSTTTTTTTPGHGPYLIVDGSPMMIGETRLVTVVPPDGNGTVERLYNFDVPDNLSYEYAGSGNEFYITALAPGRAKVHVSAEGEGLQLYVDYGYCILTITDETAPATEVTTYSTDDQTGETTVAVKEPSLGDLDGDAQVNAKDAADILIDAAYVGASGEHYLPADVVDFADVNKNGSVDAEDASFVLTYAAEAGGNPDIPVFETYMDEQTSKPVHIFSGNFVKSETADRIFNHVITNKEDLLRIIGELPAEGYLSACDDDFFAERNLAVFLFSEYVDNVEYSYLSAETDANGNNVVHLQHVSTLTNDDSLPKAYWTLWLETDKTVTSTNQISIDTEYKTVSPAGDPHVQDVKFFRYNSMREADGTVLYIASAEALKEYFSDAEDNWVQMLGQSKEELDALLAKYDDAYFEEHTLLLAARTEGSGSITMQYADTTVDIEGRNCVNIQRIVPEVGTCDMAYWYLFIEADKEIKGISDIQVEYHDIYA